MRKRLKRFAIIALPILIIVAIAFTCGFLLGNSKDGSELVFDAESFAAELPIPDEKGIIIDLRDNSDFTKAHIDGAINIPFDDGGKWLLSKLQEMNINSKSVYLICYSGKRSAEAYNLLRDSGYKNIKCLIFGYDKLCEYTGMEKLSGSEICDCYKQGNSNSES